MPRRLTHWVLVVALFSASFQGVSAATLPSGFTETLIASGLANPTAMAFSPDGRLFICLQGGQVRIVKNGALRRRHFSRST